MRFNWLFRLRRGLRQENGPSLALLLIAFGALALGISGAVSGLGFSLLWPTVFLGAGLGWGLAASNIAGRQAFILSLLSGPLLVSIQITNLVRPLASLIISPFLFLWQAISLQSWPVTSIMSDGWRDVARPLIALTGRLNDWLMALVQGDPVTDPVAVAFLWALALWATAAWGGWAVRQRNQPLAGLLPALFLFAWALAVAGGSAFLLAAALGLALILRAVHSQRQQEHKWRRDQIDFSSRFGRDTVWTASGLALALMVGSLLMPSFSIYRLFEGARSLFQDEQVAISLGLEPESPAQSDDPFVHDRRGGLPARHLIGTGPELAQLPVMAITVESSASPASQLRYWRGLTYDRYTGRGWETRGTTTISYGAGEAAGDIPDQQRQVRLEIDPLTPGAGRLYAAGRPLTVDRDFQIAWRIRYRGTEQHTDFFAGLLAGGQDRAYRVDSLLPTIDETSLREAGPTLPDWVAEHYLVLPEGVSDRVLTLARDLTVAEPTPYDRALAIERHLRQFPYTLDLPAPPAGREIADYFLFDLQRGYCDYYATTMVVLARAAGLPARLATGYIGGTYNEKSRRFVVTADLAHSWPELYFSGHGWIPFEPTAGREAIERQTGTQLLPESEPETELEPITAARNRARWNLVLGVLGGVFLVAAASALGWWLWDLWRLRLLPPELAMSGLYGQLSRSSRWLDVRPGAGETPHEFAGRLSARLLALSKSKRGGERLASSPGAVEHLTSLYTRALFSTHIPGPGQMTSAIRTWSGLRLQLLWAAALARLEKSL